MPTYDIEAMLIEVELALDWYAPAVARGNPSSGARMQFLALWREIIPPVLASRRPGRCATSTRQPALAFQSRRSAALGLIDFQDAVRARRPMNVASLLQDARVAVPEDLELRLLAHIRADGARAPIRVRCHRLHRRLFDMGAQRANNILGLFPPA